MPEIKFNGQTYTVLHTSATANKVLGVKQRSEKKGQERRARKTYTTFLPAFSLCHATLSVASSALIKRHTRHWHASKKKIEGGRDTNGVVVGVGKSKETQRRRSGALKFSWFFFAASLLLGGRRERTLCKFCIWLQTRLEDPATLIP